MMRRLAAALRPSLKQNVRNLRQLTKQTLHEMQLEFRFGSDLRKAATGKSGLLLHVGCGPRILDGWLNIDFNPSSKGAFYFNAINPLPIATGTVERIHCEHFLEHLNFEDAERFIGECRRVLGPSGSLRIIVPDAGKYMTAYAARDAAYFDQLKHLGNASTPLETPAIICNQMFRMGGDHRFAWDFETLSLVGRRQGFGSIELSDWRQAPAAYEVDGRDDWRRLESLFAELRV